MSESGISVRPGGTVALGGAVLSLEAGSAPIVVEKVSLSGSGIDPGVADLRAVGLYVVDESGIIGADARPGTIAGLLSHRLLALPVTVTGGDRPKGIVALLTATQIGTWRSDYVELQYRVGGQEFHERLRVGLGLCVTETPDADCDNGQPEWWPSARFEGNGAGAVGAGPG